MAQGYDIGASVAAPVSAANNLNSPTSVWGGGVTNAIAGVLSRGAAPVAGITGKTLWIVAGAIVACVLLITLFFRK